MERRYFYSPSELSSEDVSPCISPIFVKDGDDGAAGDEVSFNAGKEVGNTAVRSRSDLTSLEYFSDFSALVRVIIVDMFCILGSVSVLARLYFTSCTV